LSKFRISSGFIDNLAKACKVDHNNFYTRQMKFFIYFLIFVFAENALVANQLAKIPSLFSHFAEHQDRIASLSFIQFLELHYGDEIPNDQDDQRDMELPFKKISTASVTIAFVAVPVNLLSTPWPERIISFGRTNKNLLTRILLNSLFRPPRY
jgi:hypothetical protein